MTDRRGSGPHRPKDKCKYIKKYSESKHFGFFFLKKRQFAEFKFPFRSHSLARFSVWGVESRESRVKSQESRVKSQESRVES